MKKSAILAVVVLLMASVGEVMAQAPTSSTGTQLSASIIIPEQEGVSSEARASLKALLSKVAVRNGMFAGYGDSRFFITAQVVVSTKDVVPGSPARVAENIDFVFFMADNVDKKIFSTTTISVKSVAQNEQKCVMDAVRKISPDNYLFDAFISEGCSGIRNYYYSSCSDIIAKARQLAAMQKYEEAFFLLGSVPAECHECYVEATEAGNQLFAQYADVMCQKRLANARSAWSATQNEMGAIAAAAELRYIYPGSVCYDDAQSLLKEIKSSISDLRKFEAEMAKQQYKDEVEMQKQAVEAWKEVGVAYGCNQQPVSNSHSWLVK